MGCYNYWNCHVFHIFTVLRVFLACEMASANVPGEGENPFLSQLERARVELREKVARAHQVLRERETALLSELQQLENTYRGEGVDRQVDQLRIIKEQVVATLTNNENKEFLEQNVALLDTQMRELAANLETARDRMRRVELEWDRKLDRILSSTGSIRVRGVPDYKEKAIPLMVAGKHREERSSAPGEFHYPQSIAIDSVTSYIYICDAGNKRVQVFNESLEFLFRFSEEMDSPFGICIHLNKVYVTQFDDNSLSVYSTEGRYIQSVGIEGKKELEFYHPTGVAVSSVNNLIYICDCWNYRIQCLNLNLTFNSFISEVIQPRDVKLTSQDVVVLTRGSPCIHFYDYSHQLIRQIITRGEGNLVINPWYFCLDRKFNILITDFSADRVLIFSNRGHLLHKFGKRGEGRGDLIYPTAIALDRNDRIILLSENPNHCVQIF